MFDGKSEKVTDFSCCIVFNECSVWEGVVLEASSNLPDRLKNVYVGCEIGEDSPGWHIYSRSEEFIRELSLTIVNNDEKERYVRKSSITKEMPEFLWIVWTRKRVNCSSSSSDSLASLVCHSVFGWWLKKKHRWWWQLVVWWDGCFFSFLFFSFLLTSY